MAVDIKQIIQAETLNANVNSGQQNVAASDDSAPWGYWRKPDGHVTFLSYGANGDERAHRGFMSLMQYGKYRIAAGPGQWQVGNDPYLMLVVNNGVKEMPAEQVIGLNWTRKPWGSSHESHKILWKAVDKLKLEGHTENEALHLVFPQFDGQVFPITYHCEFCPPFQGIFNQENHVRTHQSVMHKDQMSHRDQTNAITTALETAGGGSNDAIARLADILAAQIQGSADERKETQALMLQMIAGLSGATLAPAEPVTAEPAVPSVEGRRRQN